MTKLPKKKHFLKRVYDCLGVKGKLRRSQREGVCRGGLGDKRLLSWGSKNLQEAMIQTSAGP